MEGADENAVAEMRAKIMRDRALFVLSGRLHMPSFLFFLFGFYFSAYAGANSEAFWLFVNRLFLKLVSVLALTLLHARVFEEYLALALGGVVGWFVTWQALKNSSGGRVLLKLGWKLYMLPMSGAIGNGVVSSVALVSSRSNDLGSTVYGLLTVLATMLCGVGYFFYLREMLTKNAHPMAKDQEYKRVPTSESMDGMREDGTPGGLL